MKRTRCSGRCKCCTSCRPLLWALTLAGVAGLQIASPIAAGDGSPGGLQLQPGDRICLIGNTLAERMQHDGWLETLLQNRFPQHRLTFRNLGFSGDELTVRLRSSNFGSPDDQLSFHKADVIFAFFGYNESHAGAEGLSRFRSDLENLVQQMLGKQYNGSRSPRLVLLSPIAHEDCDDRNLPDGSQNNRRIAMYTAAMAEVAEACGAGFVDLFAATQTLYQKTPQQRTINGIHLNAAGNRAVAELIERTLFGAPSRRDPQSLERLRQAVLDKNFYWFHRYRTTDGFSIYGGRSGLRFVDGQTNRDVMAREMEILEVMTAKRDRRVWAVAAGGDLLVDAATRRRSSRSRRTSPTIC